jgi:hypothetical protein
MAPVPAKFPLFSECISAFDQQPAPVAAIGSSVGIAAAGQTASSVETSAPLPARSSLGALMGVSPPAPVLTGTGPAVVLKVYFRQVVGRAAVGCHKIHCRLRNASSGGISGRKFSIPPKASSVPDSSRRENRGGAHISVQVGGDGPAESRPQILLRSISAAGRRKPLTSRPFRKFLAGR